MNFQYKLKKKKGYRFLKRYDVLPFPMLEDEDERVPCVFNGYSVEVTDHNYFALIYDNGNFGKGSTSRSIPRVLRKKRSSYNDMAKQEDKFQDGEVEPSLSNVDEVSPKLLSSINCQLQNDKTIPSCSKSFESNPKIESTSFNVNLTDNESTIYETNAEEILIESPQILETLVLDLEETYFLAHYVKILEVKNFKGELLDDIHLFLKFCNIKPHFPFTIVTYLYLKHKEWIVKTGMKYGANFLIYKEGINLYHASFAVVIENVYSLDILDAQSLHRVAESANKDVMIIKVTPPIDLDMKNLQEVHKRLNDFTCDHVVMKRFEINKIHKI